MSDENDYNPEQHASDELEQPASVTKRVAIEIGKHQESDGEEGEEAEAAEDENADEDEQSDDGGEATTPSVKDQPKAFENQAEATHLEQFRESGADSFHSGGAKKAASSVRPSRGMSDESLSCFPMRSADDEQEVQALQGCIDALISFDETKRDQTHYK